MLAVQIGASQLLQNISDMNLRYGAMYPALANATNKLNIIIVHLNNTLAFLEKDNEKIIDKLNKKKKKEDGDKDKTEENIHRRYGATYGKLDLLMRMAKIGWQQDSEDCAPFPTQRTRRDCTVLVKTLVTEI